MPMLSSDHTIKHLVVINSTSSRTTTGFSVLTIKAFVRAGAPKNRFSLDRGTWVSQMPLVLLPEHFVTHVVCAGTSSFGTANACSTVNGRLCDGTKTAVHMVLRSIDVVAILSSQGPASEPSIEYLVGVRWSCLRTSTNRGAGAAGASIGVVTGVDTLLVHRDAAAAGMRPTSWTRPVVEHLVSNSMSSSPVLVVPVL